MSDQHSEFQIIFQVDDEFSAGPKAQVHPKLPPGCYQVRYNERIDHVTFLRMKPTHDALVDLPDTEYDEVCKDIDLFLTPECEQRFRDMGFLYKFNAFMFGKPGTGKTCIVNRVSQKIIKQGGIVLFNPPPKAFRKVYQILDAIQPETRVMVILEEFDQIAKSYEEILLHVLDGEIQKENAMYLATTNYIEKVPPRLLRPGRFNTVIEVKPPKYRARLFYLQTKLADKLLAEKIAKLTDGFTIDELRDVVRATYCLQKDLDATVSRLGRGKKNGVSAAAACIGDDCDGCPECCDFDGDDDDDDDDQPQPKLVLRAAESSGN